MTATLGDVLRHLVRHAPNLSDDNRAEYLEAVTDAHPETELEDSSGTSSEASGHVPEGAPAGTGPELPPPPSG